DFFNKERSTLASKPFVIISSSVPSTSDNNNSLPSQSTFNGSSKEISVFNLLLRLRYIKISFSIHLEAYVANLIFFSVFKVLTPFIRPIAPMLIKSSILIRSEERRVGIDVSSECETDD